MTHQTNTATAETLAQLLSERYSCRAYLPRRVDDQVIARILAMAQRTPSWCNAQPWNVVVTSDAATERLRAGLLADATGGAAARFDLEPPQAYVGRYQERRKECGVALYEAVGVQKGDRQASARQATENFRLFGAPHVAIVTTDRDLGVYGAVDCGAYVSNFMLAARSLGVSCIAQAALASRSDFLRIHFNLPHDRVIVCGVSFGYEDPHHPANSFRTGRGHWEQEATLLSA